MPSIKCTGSAVRTWPGQAHSKQEKGAAVQITCWLLPTSWHL